MMYEQQEEERAEFISGRRQSRIGIDEERLEIVDLSGLGLQSLPNPSLNLGIICKLDLSNNNLSTIPESLTARLLNVMVLDVHSNQLKSLPNSIGCLSKLKILNISGNLIRTLPKTILNCRSLEELNANFNKLTKLPESTGIELTNLKKLFLICNKLILLPSSTAHLINLEILDVRLNCLHSLPEDIDNLQNLRVLNVSQNFQYFAALPYSIGILSSLVDLDVSYNTITSLPGSIGCLKKLQRLCVEGNPLVSPPPEVFEQGIHTVKQYLSEKMNGTTPQTNSPKKRSWIRKLKKYGTFNGATTAAYNNRGDDSREGFLIPNYRSVDSLASPRPYNGIFLPFRRFSSKTYFSR